MNVNNSTRRSTLSKGVAIVALLASASLFSGCAAVGQLVPDVQLTRQELQTAIEKKTPFIVPVAQTAEIQIFSPQVLLFPKTQTIGLNFQLLADAPFLRQKWSGSFGVEFSVRYVAERQQFQLVQPKLKQLAIPALPSGFVEVVERALNQSLQKSLNGYPVYQLSTEESAKLKRYALSPGQLLIQAESIVLPLHTNN